MKPAIGRMSWRAWPVLVCMGCLTPGGAQQALSPAEENTGANRSIARVITGHYAYSTLSGARPRGTEEFRLTVFRDGSRQIMMWLDLFAKDAQFTSGVSSDARGGPREAYVHYWNQGAFKGSAWIRVDGPRLQLHSRGPAGEVSQQLDVPEQFSLGTHPISGDGWHFWYVDQTAGSGTSSLGMLEASADTASPVTIALRALPFARLGEENVTTPAGSFHTVHYRFNGANDLWVMATDHILVKSESVQSDRSYVLTQLSTQSVCEPAAGCAAKN